MLSRVFFFQGGRKSAVLFSAAMSYTANRSTIGMEKVMGYCAQLVESKFFIKRDNLEHVFRSIQAYAQRAIASGEHIYWVTPRTLLAADTVEAQFRHWGWPVKRDFNGNVAGIGFEHEKIGEEMKLFELIAPFVEKGSYLDMAGEDGANWRWSFNGQTCKELQPKVSYADDDSDVVDVEVREVRPQRRLR
jgi:hypothetical protein